jgi:hypothetical protein
MTESEWRVCGEPDLLLEEVENSVNRRQLVEFVRRCWERILSFLPDVHANFTVVEEFAALAEKQSDHDAALYAAEAALKAARWAPDLKEEQRQQAVLLRQIVSPARPSQPLAHQEMSKWLG